jgi:hypothetical protein
MKATVVLLGAVAALVATASGSSPQVASGSTSGLLRLPRATRAGEVSLWGHIKSLAHRGGQWEMKFDPGLPLHGATAEHAALEDTGSKDVPNDVYIVEEGRRRLTYVVSRSASVTILTAGLKATKISLPELAQIVVGKNPNGRRLFGRPTAFGFWIRVGLRYPNPVLSIDQQYQP